MKTYQIKEIFSTLQGEGFHAGRAAVFVRFAGCNLWSGREEDREKGKGHCARWCDTRFVGGKAMTAEDIIREIRDALPSFQRPFVVITGGEPLLQYDMALRDALQRQGFSLALETNGTVDPGFYPAEHVTVSPKKGSFLELDHGTELRVAWPQWSYDEMRDFERLDFTHRFVSPINGMGFDEVNVKSAYELCRTNPLWRLSLQLHKVGGFR